MGRDTGIANRLRAAGIRVVECAGWTTRGSDSFYPEVSVNHHTAGPASGATPSLNTCINGRPDLEGPLCNVMQSREPDGRDIAYVVAAGRANHAGSGGWQGYSGNSSAYGLEIEHTGTDPLPQGRQDIAAAIHAALGVPASMVCQHREWAPERKIDAAENVDPDAFRAAVAAGPQEADMDAEQDKRLSRIEVMVEELLQAWRDTEGVKVAPELLSGRLRELVVGLRDESGVAIPANRVGGRIKRTDANVSELAATLLGEE